MFVFFLSVVVQYLAFMTGKGKVNAGESCFTTRAMIIRASFLETTPFAKIDDGNRGWYLLTYPLWARADS